MAAPSDNDFLRPYRDAVALHGGGFEATLWGSKEAQRLRFDVMIDLAGLDGGRIVDVGCGPGDLVHHLIERGVPYGDYIGLDAIPEMIEAARTRLPPRTQFDVVDLIADRTQLATLAPDFVCISGTLNTMDEDVARGLVTDAFEAAAQGVIFNFLSNRPHPRWIGRDLTPARRFDTAGWLDWALGMTSTVSFTQAYLDGHDATIALFTSGVGGQE